MVKEENKAQNSICGVGIRATQPGPTSEPQGFWAPQCLNSPSLSGSQLPSKMREDTYLLYPRDNSTTDVGETAGGGENLHSIRTGSIQAPMLRWALRLF